MNFQNNIFFSIFWCKIDFVRHHHVEFHTIHSSSKRYYSILDSIRNEDKELVYYSFFSEIISWTIKVVHTDPKYVQRNIIDLTIKNWIRMLFGLSLE